jgi:small-conductance mechanosensitive channel
VFFGLVGYEMGGDGFTLDLARLSLILAGFYLARAGTGFVDALLARLPASYPELERGVVNLLETCSTYVVWGLYALACLRLAGASFTSLAVVAGGLSVGIGFGLQQVINNFISGLILLFGRSIQAGDTLQIGETWGVVQRVNVRNTVVRTFDNAALLVPNSELITQKIINWSHRDRKVRRAVDVPVAFGQDPALVQEILIKAASAHPHVLKEPKPSVLLADFKDTGFLLYRLMIWVNDVNNALRTCSDVRLAVDKDLRERGLAIAGSPPQAPLTP